MLNPEESPKMALSALVWNLGDANSLARFVSGFLLSSMGF